MTIENQSPEHQNDVQETSNQDEVVNHPESFELLGEEVKVTGVTATDNEALNQPTPELDKSFDNMVDEAVKTKEQAATEKRDLKEEKPYTPELAAGVALSGLNGAVGIINKFTDTPIEVAQETQMIFAAMVTPLVMKHGKTIKSLLNPENIDLNSTVPEWLAVAAVGVVAVPSYLQVKKAKKAKAMQEVTSDEKAPENSAEKVE